MALDERLTGDLLLIAFVMAEAVAMWRERREVERDPTVRHLDRRPGTSLREIAVLAQGTDDARACAWVRSTIAGDVPVGERGGVLRRHLPDLDWDFIYGWAAATGAPATGGRVGSAESGHRTSKVMPPRYRSRRRCYCGCAGKATHTGFADGVTLVTGCELSIRRWVRTGELTPAEASPV
ncbi:hypothetical protein ACFVMC_32865 [Nocardia sp. NPDC127579]|uniref:hypothetical protein n=1 Tax=Nocardia sp. NPDC127579 TaxID=3345402 RepID=UPI003641A258